MTTNQVTSCADGDKFSAGPAPEATNVIDLMDALRRSLETARKGEPADAPEKGRRADRSRAARAGRSPEPTGGKKSTAAKDGTARSSKRAGATGKQQLSGLTKAELYQRATDLDIPHRSTMTRDELREALEHAGRPRRKAS
ncbi:hypothetical protein [Kitasatospora aureofaciens]|uniref:hypothetical protein n=1 Tax=Kitasatospora aureofaciens TaxID=1894 RepID=UPI0036F492DF